MRSLLVSSMLVASAAAVAGTSLSAPGAPVPPAASAPAVPRDRPSSSGGVLSARVLASGSARHRATVATSLPPLASTTPTVVPTVVAPRGGDAAVLRDRWSWPLAPRPPVVRPFVRPASRYGVGHRGLDLAGQTGRPVLAVDDGVVSHVGVIAGRGTVTVVHTSGLRSTYEPVDAMVRRGDHVVRGGPVGSLAGAGSHCGALACLHLGAIRDGDYVDPLTLLGGARVRLLPLG